MTIIRLSFGFLIGEEYLVLDSERSDKCSDFSILQ